MIVLMGALGVLMATNVSAKSQQQASDDKQQLAAVVDNNGSLSITGGDTTNDDCHDDNTDTGGSRRTVSSCRQACSTMPTQDRSGSKAQPQGSERNRRCEFDAGAI